MVFVWTFTTFFYVKLKINETKKRLFIKTANNDIIEKKSLTSVVEDGYNRLLFV